ncbi:MAG TPA: universal stress protein [Candidatus Dormibacteraeota bacterium]|nr:universal stress protein [Candidatus Dormibacteraeota bacterium]
MAASKTGIRRIAIGVDGSEASSAALKWAIRLAKGLGSQVIAVYAVDIPVYFPEPEELPFVLDQEWRAGMKSEFEDKWCKPLKVAGIKYRTVMEDGRAASVIAAVAERENADVIVVGRRGRGGVSELLLGSASHELVLHSKRPVLVVSAKG